MNILSMLRILFPAAAFRRAARAVALDTLPADSAQVVWARAVDIHSGLVKRRVRQSLGVGFLLRYMEWDCALYKSLLEMDVELDKAGRLIQQINWSIFQPATSALFKWSRLRSADLLTRIRWMHVLLFLFLFTHPFKRGTYLPGQIFAFDVTVCPLAQFFLAQEVPELTHYAACSLDFLMAKDWGVELKREGTIAGGRPLCDFRFHAISQNPARTKPVNSVYGGVTQQGAELRRWASPKCSTEGSEKQ